MITLLYSFAAVAGTVPVPRDTSGHLKQPSHYLLMYVRGIMDAKGRQRMDENVVGNFKLLNWLRLEAGFRQGERPHLPCSYYHYKLELQTRYFYKTLRVLARLSDNVINDPSPSYRKTNKLVVLEGKYRISRRWHANGGLGYLFSAQQYHVPDARPTDHGVHLSSPLYRLGLRYYIKHTSVIEADFGTYDVFNPYAINEPFVQLAAEQDLSERLTLYSYFRYQFHRQLSDPMNYFLCLGLRFNW